ncbi:MAG: DsbA family protein [Hyphomicrobium sp.]
MREPFRKALAFAGLGVALAVAGCGADGLPPTAPLTKDGPAAGGAYPSVASETPDEAPRPLSDPSDKPAGGRDVIEAPTMTDILAPSPLAEMSWGSEKAPVTLIEYASLTCPHCRRFHLETFPELKKTYIDTGKVRYILREFPIGKQSGNATIALRCAPQDKYLELFGKFMEQQSSWVSQEVRLDPIFAVARQVGMTRPQFDACLKNQGMIQGLKWVKDRGRKLGVIGTPNFFVGDKLVKSVLTMAEIAALVEPTLQAAAQPR